MDELTSSYLSTWTNQVLPHLQHLWLVLSVPLLGLALLVSGSLWINKKN